MELRKEAKGYTLVELLVVIGILVLAMGTGVVIHRSSRAGSGSLAANISFHMEVRSATDKLHEVVSEGTEIVKPSVGGSLPYLVFKDIQNFTRIVYLERAKDRTSGPNLLVAYTDRYLGKPDPTQRKILFDQVKSVSFTPQTHGLVVVRLTLVDQKEKEETSLFEISLKNFGAIDG